MKVCFKEEMRAIDKAATEQFNIPSLVLMENAALSCVREIEHFESFLIFCGKGNNAGDGLAIARHLINKGKSVKIYLLLGDDFLGDAKVNYDILKCMGAEILTDFDGLKTDLMLFDCCVDAIFGTGLSGEVKSPTDEVISLINENARYVLSVDVPSGIDANSGKIHKIAVKADKTVTFAAYKAGLLLYPAADFTGEIVVADISIPGALLSGINRDTIDSEFIRKIMPKRCENSHKGDFGKIFIIGGSVGMAGAVTMAANAAFASGAGIVTACVPVEINDIIQKTAINSMTYPVSFKDDIDKITQKMQGYDVILFGNGIGRAGHIGKLLEAVLKKAAAPVVIDADGLFHLAQNPEMIKALKGEVIITPHAKEMARLCEKSADFVEKNRMDLSLDFAKKYQLTLVLKGNHTIITAPKGDLFINLTGNSGMATAGSGDVLAGMCAAFLAQTKDAKSAACLSVYLHGLAGDLLSFKKSRASMTAIDIIDELSHILPVENQ